MKMCLIILLLIGGNKVQGQTFGEWFRQKKTRLKYMQQQVAALEAYIAVVEEGHKIVERGAQMITAIKKGDYDLHSWYFTSLAEVKPAISGSPLIAAIKNLQERTIEAAGSSPAVIAPLFQRIIVANEEDMDWLEVLTSNRVIVLKDEERLDGMEAIYERMRKRLTDALRIRDMIRELKSKNGL